MTKYNILILKWSNLQLNKLKLKKKKKKSYWSNFKLTSNLIGNSIYEPNFPH